MVKKINKSVRRDFEVFAKGVERLEQIRDELRNLDAKKYGAEVSSIKSKLNNVSYLPEIERELIDLKAKINGTYKERKKINKAHANINKKINELKNKIPKEHYNIHKKIEELRETIPNKEKIYGKINELEKEIKKVSGMSNIKNQLNYFKDFIIKQNKEEERKKYILSKIDPEVSFKVNDKFNLTLNDIKTELYEKTHKKELDIQKQLHEDLEERKLNFKKQYRDLEKKFEEEYHDRVKTSLKAEIKNKLKLQEIGGRLQETERKKLSELKSEKSDLRNLKKKFLLDKNKKSEELERKRVILEKEYKKKMEAGKKSLKEHFNEEVLIHQAILDKKMHEHLTQETKKVHENYSKKLKKKEDESYKIKQALLNEKGLFSKIKTGLNLKMRKIKEDEENYKSRLRENLEKQKYKEIEGAVRKQSEIIKDRLKKEFEERLKLAIKAKEAEFEKKKSVLALEIQNKARQLFV